MPRLRLAYALTVLFACAAELPPALEPPKVGLIVGEIFVEDPERRSLGGAEVTVPGTSARATTVEGKQFVLTAIPVGDHVLDVRHEESGRVARIPVSVGAAGQTVILPAEKTLLTRAASLTGRVQLDGDSAAGTVVFLVGGRARQSTLAGDDGSFLLEGLPTGAARIGVSRAGYETKVVDASLAEGDNTLDEVSLAGSSAGNLALQGVVQLADRKDHAGVAVLLNGGEKVAITDKDGRYTFSDLTSGQYELRATLAGYRSVELPMVALTPGGAVEGLVAALMTPGSDADASVAAVDRPFTARITSPSPGAGFEEGQTITLLAEVSILGETIPESRVRWTATGLEPQTPPVALGQGRVVSVSDLPLGLHRIEVRATASDGTSVVGDSFLEVTPLHVGAEIVSPATQQRLPTAAPVLLSVELEVRDGVAVRDEDVVWSWRALGDPSAPQELGRGRQVVATLPAVSQKTFAEIIVDVTTTSPARSRSASVSVELAPFRPRAATVALYSHLPIALPQGVEVLDDDGRLVRVDYAIAEGQPVVLGAGLEADFAGTVRWDSDTGFAFPGAEADLSVLPVGHHALTLSVGDAGATTTSRVDVEVAPFDFKVTVVEPVLQPTSPYYVDFGLPLKATVSHPWQQAFLPQNIRWISGDGRVIAGGLQSRGRGLDAGPGIVTFEVEDALGHLAQATGEYVLQTIEFTAAITQPAEGTSVLEGSPITARVAATHSLMDAGALTVRWLSSIQGLLVDAQGQSTFAADEPATFDALTAGRHVLTARVSDGGRISEATRIVEVRTPGVTATRASPKDQLVVFPGTAVAFQATVNHDASVTPLVSWYLDGAEFDPAWGGYGADATAVSRRSIDFGVYDAGQAPFTDPRWAPGPHEVRLFVRLDDVDPQLGCVNIPNRAVCLRSTLQVAPADPDIFDASGTVVINAGQTVVWDGVRRLKSKVELRGGTLVVNPGARILIESTGSPSARYIRVVSGELRVGRADSPLPVVFEDLTTAAAARWDGFQLQPTSGAGTGAIVAVFENTTIADTTVGITATSTWAPPAHSLELRDVTFRRTRTGVQNVCPQTAERLRFIDVPWFSNNGAFEEGSGGGCGADRVYRHFYFHNVHTGFELRDEGSVRIENSVFSSMTWPIVTTSSDWFPRAGDLTVVDSVFDSAGSNESAVQSSGCGRITLTRNVIRGARHGVYATGCGDGPDGEAPRTRLTGNVFVGNATAVRVLDNGPDAPEIHLNTFVDNVTHFEAARSGSNVWNAPDLQAQGNFLGHAGDLTSTAGALLARPAGTLSKLPRVKDHLVSTSNGRLVQVDHPLAAPTALPAALAEYLDGTRFPPTPLVTPPVPMFIRTPSRTGTVSPSTCTRFSWEAPLFDEPLSCQWFAAPEGQPLGEPLSVAPVSGCVDTTLFARGAWSLRLTCEDEGGAVFTQDSAFVVEDRARNGTLTSSETWSGVVTLDGDLEVPEGLTLTLAPGTTVKMAASDRLRRAGWVTGDQQALRQFGAREQIDLLVKGTLRVEGQPGAPVRFEAGTGVDLADQWGGIRLFPGAAAYVTHARLSGANVAFHAAYDSRDNTRGATLEVTHTEVVAATDVLKGAAPAVFTDNVLRDVRFIGNPVVMHQPLVLARLTATALASRSGDAVFDFFPHPVGAPPSLAVVLQDSAFERAAGDRNGRLLDTNTQGGSSYGLVRLSGVTARHFHSVAEPYYRSDRSEAVEVLDSTLENFDRVLAGHNNSLDEVRLEGSVLRNVRMLFEGNVGRYLLLDNRFESVSTPFLNVSMGTTGELTAHGNLFRDTGDVFQLRVALVENAQFAADLSGNAFEDTGRVVTINPQYLAGANTSDRGITLDVDLTGSWFGTDDDAAIRALISDPQPQIDPQHVGRTRYAPFATGPLQ